MDERLDEIRARFSRAWAARTDRERLEADTVFFAEALGDVEYLIDYTDQLEEDKSRLLDDLLASRAEVDRLRSLMPTDVERHSLRECVERADESSASLRDRCIASEYMNRLDAAQKGDR